jgi:hypothetical protein
LSQAAFPPEEDVDDVDDVLDDVAELTSTHRPSPTCAQT